MFCFLCPLRSVKPNLAVGNPLTKLPLNPDPARVTQLVQWLGDSDDIEKWKEWAKCKKIVFSDRCEKCKAFSLWELKCQVQSERFVRHLAFMID